MNRLNAPLRTAVRRSHPSLVSRRMASSTPNAANDATFKLQLLAASVLCISIPAYLSSTSDAYIKGEVSKYVKEIQATGGSSLEKTDKSEPASDAPAAADASASDGLSEQEEPQDIESQSQAAFNPETGEINWDCPCLGGMAHGPCGEEFKTAFSCFVYSEADPKGIDCVEKFKGMQDCFRKHPEVYADDIDEETTEELVESAHALLEKPDAEFKTQ